MFSRNRPPQSSGEATGSSTDAFLASSYDYGTSGGLAPGVIYPIYGIPIDNYDTAILARKVLLISLLMALLALLSSIFQLISGIWFSIGILTSIILPLCGYLGVYHKRRWLLLTFSFLNTFLAILFLASFIAVITTFKEDGDFINCLCNTDCRSRHHLSERDAEYVCTNPSLYRTFWWLSMTLGFGMMILQCLGGYYSYELSTKPWFFAITNPNVTPPRTSGWFGFGRPVPIQPSTTTGYNDMDTSPSYYPSNYTNYYSNQPIATTSSNRDTRYTYARGTTGGIYSAPS